MKNKNTVWKVAIGLIIVAILGVGVYAIYTENKTQDKEPVQVINETPWGSGELKDGYIPTMSVEDREQLAKEKMDASKFTSSADNAAIVTNGREVKYNIANVEQNKFPFYFTMSINGKEYYKSPLIIPGKRMENFEIKEPLAKGEYTASIMLNVLDNNNKQIGARELVIKAISQ